MRLILRFLCVALILVGTSCVSNKEMIYIQKVDSLYQVPRAIEKSFELRIQPDDELAIIVSSKDKELVGFFDTQMLIGGGSGGSANGGGAQGVGEGLAYFLVDKEGYIVFPVFGKLRASGRTPQELSAEIQERMVTGNYIKDAVVTTRIMSFKVTVLGDVKAPGTQTHTGERLTILEALGRAGDLNGTAIRNNIIVLREENGKRVAYKVDLTNTEGVFQSPAYYLQQNDLIYVESNKSVKLKNAPSYAYMGLVGTLVGLASSITALVFTLAK